MIQKIWLSFPIQLLVLHLRKNLALVLVWGLLFLIIFEGFGLSLGIPFLFLDPEYLNQVSWLSFLLMGLGFAVFTMAFHMTTYIMDGRTYSFLAILPKPFIHFCINNSIIPLIFYGVYCYRFVQFQLQNDLDISWRVLSYFGGFSLGSLLTYGLIFGYFSMTNKDFFVLFAGTLDRKLRKVKFTRKNVISRHKDIKNKPQFVRNYLSLGFRFVAVRPDISRFQSAKLLKVFDQNHLNLFLIQVFLISLVVVLGLFKEEPILQLPAATSAMLLLAILLMMVGAVSFWLRDWAAVVVLMLLLLVNHFSNFSFLNRPHEAFGLDYQSAPAPYNLQRLESLVHPDTLQKDFQNTLQILTNWKKNTGKDKPKLVMIAASGGGQRAALWTFVVMQHLYQLGGGKVLKHTEFLSGASGGVLGEAFFRELYLRSLEDSAVNPLDSIYLDQLAADKLNPIIFSLLVNDLVIRNQYFRYNERKYLKDRGYSFENQLNINTQGVLDKPIKAYREAEFSGKIPLLPVTTLITNDGRKLVISPHSMSYLGTSIQGSLGLDEKKQSIDFLRFFRDQDAENLRFLTALRMSATFPFITPNVQLPSDPVMETMDTGLSDNFGIQDALRFAYVFQEWIRMNTSGIVLVTIRDSQKSTEIPTSSIPRIGEKIFNPLKNIFSNWDNVQTIQNEVLVNYMAESMPFPLDRVEFEYAPELVHQGELTGSQKSLQRASLNWRLTAREKKTILLSIQTEKNQHSLRRMDSLLVE